MQRPIYKKWWFWVLAAFVVIAIRIGTTDNDKPKTNKNNAANPNVPPNTSTQQDNGTTGNRAASEAKGKTAFVFKNLLIKSELGMSTVYGEVTNKDSKAHSFTVKVSFYGSSGKLLGSAAGAVNDLNSGSTKTFSAIATEDYSGASSYKADVDTVVATSSNKKEVINFSDLINKTNSGAGTVEGEAKNTDTKKHSFTIMVSFYDKSGKLTGVASGAVNDLAPGQIKTFSAISTEDVTSMVRKKVQVDTLVD